MLETGHNIEENMLFTAEEESRILMKHNFIKSVFLSYAAELRNFVSGKFGDAHEADDIVQDAFRNLLRMESPEKIEDPKAYLYKTAKNLALNRIRKQKHHENYLLSQEHGETSLSLDRTANAQRDLEKLQSAVTKLPPKCQKAFLLSRVHHKTYAEIGQELGVSVSTVEKYIITALQFLREQLER